MIIIKKKEKNNFNIKRNEKAIKLNDMNSSEVIKYNELFDNPNENNILMMKKLLIILKAFIIAKPLSYEMK